MKKSKKSICAEALRPFHDAHQVLQARSEASSKEALVAVRAALRALRPLEDVLKAEEAELARRMAKALDELEADLGDLAKRRGWRLEGGWPTFQVERGIEVRIDAVRGEVRVASRKFDVTDLAAVERAIGELVGELVPKKFDPTDFLGRLETACLACGEAGTQIAIWDAYARMVVDLQPQRFWREAVRERFVPLSPDQFRAQLAAILEAGATITPSNRELVLLPPLDPKDALFVYLPAEKRFAFVGRILFAPAVRS